MRSFLRIEGMSFGAWTWKSLLPELLGAPFTSFTPGAQQGSESGRLASVGEVTHARRSQYLSFYPITWESSRICLRESLVNPET